MAARTTVRFGRSFQITVVLLLLQADFGQLCNSSPAAHTRKDHVKYPQQQNIGCALLKSPLSLRGETSFLYHLNPLR